MGELGLVLGLTGADTGLEGRYRGPLEKKPLEGLPEPKGLSTCTETDKWVRSPVTVIPAPLRVPCPQATPP